MNVWNDDHSAINHYYDGDFPGQTHCRFPENFDEVTVYQGLRFDVSRYVEIASETGGPVLEPCCGTGRVALPLAEAGLEVVGVDLSRELIRQFRSKMECAEEARDRITIVEQDITRLALARRDFPLSILAFNSLLCLTDFTDQCSALSAIAAHLANDGLLVIDIVNPLRLPLQGDPVPKPFFTRRNPHTGRQYTRFATLSPLDASHCQRLQGWYDETDESGVVTRRPYSVTWRPIFRYEIELMLRAAGLTIVKVEGGHRGEVYAAESPRMFIHARKKPVR
jgi:SAM-dependent methyltransferase